MHVLPRIPHGRSSGAVKLHSWVTTLGQQGTEPDLRIYAVVHRCERIRAILQTRDRALYALAHSSRSAPPSVTKALKRTPSVFVFPDLYRITAPRLYSTQHSHSGPYRLGSTIPAHEILAKRTVVSKGATMQHPVYRLLRILLPHTRVNKGKEKGRGVMPRPSISSFPL
jgi:hypothetical protein